MNTIDSATNQSIRQPTDTQSTTSRSVVQKYLHNVQKAENNEDESIQLIDLQKNTVDFLSRSMRNNKGVKSFTSRYNILISVPKPRQTLKTILDLSEKKGAYRKGKQMNDLLSISVPEYESRKNAICSMVENSYSGDVHFNEPTRSVVPVEDCLNVRRQGGFSVSNAAINQILQDFVKILNCYGMLRVKTPLLGLL